MAYCSASSGGRFLAQLHSLHWAVPMGFRPSDICMSVCKLPVKMHDEDFLTQLCILPVFTDSCPWNLLGICCMCQSNGVSQPEQDNDKAMRHDKTTRRKSNVHSYYAFHKTTTGQQQDKHGTKSQDNDKTKQS